MRSQERNSLPPWIGKRRQKQISTKAPDAIRYHQEILSFVRYIQLNSEEKNTRNRIIESVKDIVRSIYPSAEIGVYGSYETELCVPQSDIDLVVFKTSISSENRENCETNVAALFELSERIKDSGICKSDPIVISSARVPIIKFVDKESEVMVDISFECTSGLESTELIKQYMKRYPLLRPLTLVIKYYLKQRYLNETWTGGIGSFTLVVMVLSFLQMQTPSGGRVVNTLNGEDLSTLVTNFLQFYASQFDYLHTVISVLGNGNYLRKADKNWFSETLPDALSVEDPQNPENDLAVGSYRIQDARQVFMEGFWNLTSKSQRWSHTHSFLARLFEAGTNPEIIRQEKATEYTSYCLESEIRLPMISSQEDNELEQQATSSNSSKSEQNSALIRSPPRNSSNSSRHRMIRGQKLSFQSQANTTQKDNSKDNSKDDKPKDGNPETQTKPLPSNRIWNLSAPEYIPQTLSKHEPIPIDGLNTVHIGPLENPPRNQRQDVNQFQAPN